MARPRYDTGLKLTTTQRVLGWCYLPFYLVLTAWLLSWAFRKLGIPLDIMELNILYFGVNFVFVLLVFHRFLWKSFRRVRDDFWLFVQTLILGFALYYLSSIVLSMGMGFVFGEYVVANDEVVSSLVVQNRGLMFLATVIAAPIVEEVLIRGVVFGSFHRMSRYLAYAVSMLVFSLMHVWQYVTVMDWQGILANTLTYLPAGVALGWTYEKSGTIWCPIGLHALINALAYGITLAF